MSVRIKTINRKEIDKVVPLIYELNDGKISNEVLLDRFNEMVNQNYECIGVYDGDDLIGVCGLWFCTRHYCGKSVELDHVFIKEDYRNKGIGKTLMTWLRQYVKSKNSASIELNTYVNNYPSHKFYYNEGMEIWGYHFFKYL